MDPLPMPDDVITHVNQMSNEPHWEGEDVLTENDLLNVRYKPMDQSECADMEADTLSVNNDASDEEVPGINAPEIHEELEDMVELDAIGNIGYDNNESTSEKEQEIIFEAMVDEDSYKENPVEFGIEQQMDMTYGPRSGVYNLQPRKARDYGHLYSTFNELCLTQYNLKKGLELFAYNGIMAVQTELRQLHDRDVIAPVKHNNLSENDRKNALPYLMVLKQEQTGQIKGRGCADGRQQRIYSHKEDASSPTIMIESVMLTSVIDAFEEHEIATVDIPGAFLQADMDEIEYVRMTDTMVDILSSIDTKYDDYTTQEGKKKVLYVNCIKHCTVHYKQHYCFGRNYRNNHRSGGSN
jgi:hypothetical protein